MHRAHTNIKSETIICSQCKAKLVITMHTNSQNKCNNMLICRFTNLNDLKEHIQTDHQISVDHNNYHFPSIEAFQQWKKDEEIRYNSTYILQCGSRMRQQRRYWYYYCNRSGRYEAKGKDKRSLKLQGTNKIGTAHMTVQQQPAGDVNVIYCSTHFNHSIELGHIGIPEPIRMKVVSKLQQGVREDGCALTQFFKSLKKRTGDITPNVLMTDDAEQYWNAWVGIYGPNKIKTLLCKWHIDRAWRKALQEHIANNEDKIRIYHFLQVLLSDCEKSTFTVTLQQFLSITADTYPSFHHYFLKKLL